MLAPVPACSDGWECEARRPVAGRAPARVVAVERPGQDLRRPGPLARSRRLGAQEPPCCVERVALVAGLAGLAGEAGIQEPLAIAAHRMRAHGDDRRSKHPALTRLVRAPARAVGHVRQRASLGVETWAREGSQEGPDPGPAATPAERRCRAARNAAPRRPRQPSCTRTRAPCGRASGSHRACKRGGSTHNMGGRRAYFGAKAKRA